VVNPGLACSMTIMAASVLSVRAPPWSILPGMTLLDVLDYTSIWVLGFSQSTYVAGFSWD
jgi:hypothetical protein